MELLTNLEASVNRKEVLRYLKSSEISKQGKSFAKVDSLIDECAAYVLSKAEPKAVVEEFDVKKKDENSVTLFKPKGFEIKSRSVAKLLQSCSKISLFAVTIGNKFENEDLNFMKAAFVDACASAAVESAAEKLNEIITEKAASSGYKTTQRYSCGFSDWLLENQQDVLKVINAKKIGITANAAGHMLPRKSVTALVGWYK